MSGSESSSSEAESVEMLATSRERRPNAGAKMGSLLNQEDNADDFYKEAYGGFFDEEADAGFASPPHSDSDEVDSDFDCDETQDPAPDDGDAEPNKPKRRGGVFTKAYKEPQKKQAPPKPSGALKAASSTIEASITTRQLRSPHGPRRAFARDQRTQKTSHRRPSAPRLSQTQLLAEAKKTEALNLASLLKFRELETAEKLKRGKGVKRKAMEGPRVVHISRPGLSLIVYPSDTTLVSAKLPPTPVQRPCVVTGLPARYLDPLTRLPYYNAAAFAAIRRAYDKHLQSSDAGNC